VVAVGVVVGCSCSAKMAANYELSQPTERTAQKAVFAYRLRKGVGSVSK